MKLRYIVLLAAATTSGLLFSCGSNTQKSPNDTPTSGSIHIAADESYKPLVEAEREMFEALYTRAKINVTYTSESEAYALLIADSARLIIASRKPNESETAYFEQRQLKPRITHIANDGLAFIVNNNNSCEKLLYTKIKDIFTGKTNTWKELGTSSKADSLKVIFDHAGSGNVRTIKEKFAIDNNLPANCFALNSNEEVVKFVENNQNALGIISVNWISDSADSTTIAFLDRIKVLSVGTEATTDENGSFYGPFQAYIANKSYPFVRETYIISREARSGLGTGFASFIASDKGQRIVLRSGLVPATAPVRIVNVNTQP